MIKCCYRWLVVALLLSLGLGLGLAGCGEPSRRPQVATAGSRQSAGAAGSALPVADPVERRRQFVACMSTQGVDLTEPGGDGSAREAGDSSADAAMATALEKCRQYLPTGGDLPRLAPEDIEKMRLYSQCLRDHGVPDYPDPDPETGQLGLTDELAQRLKTDPKLTVAAQACQDRLPPPGGMGGGTGGAGNGGGPG